MKKKLNHLFLIVLIGILLFGCLTGKKNQPIEEPLSKYKEPTQEFLDSLKSKIYGTSQNGMRRYSIDLSSIDFGKYAPISSKNFKSTYLSIWNLTEDDSFILEQTKPTNTGITRFYYSQHHKGFQVYDTSFRLDSIDEKVVHASGRLRPNVSVDTSNVIKVNKARELAFAATKADQFHWEYLEKYIDKYPELDTNQINTLKYPLAKRYIFNDELVYRFTIETTIPGDTRLVMINAQSGEVISNISDLQHFND